MGISLSGLGRFDEALVQFGKVIEVAPASPLGYELKGIHYHWVEGRMDEALRWHVQATILDPNTPLFNLEHTQIWLELGDLSQANCWATHNLEVAPDSPNANAGMSYVSSFRGDESQAVDYANTALTILGAAASDCPCTNMIHATLRDHDLGKGNHSVARDRYAMFFPELLSEEKPGVDYFNHRAAIDLALVLLRTGEQERADLLLSEGLAYVQGSQRLGWYGYNIGDVEIYALQGETEKALVALRQAVDSGWRFDWRYHLERNPNLDSIRDEPAFQAMLKDVQADIANQLARVRAMESTGEICAAP
jgi:tetratricopeptide (TPR) repeat protein